MKSYFTSTFFRANRKKIRDALGESASFPIVIAGNGLMQRGGDTAYAFSQDANMWYLTGIDEPDILLVMDEAEDYLIIATRDATRAAFDGALQTDDLTTRSGVSRVYDLQEGWDKLAKSLKKTHSVSTPAAYPAYVEGYGLYSNPARAHVLRRLKKIVPLLENVDISKAFIKARMIKQPAEVQAIQRAIDITIDTLTEVLAPQHVQTCRYEYQLEADITRGFRWRGASGHGFDPIVIGGARATTLHESARDKFIHNTLAVVDVGAEVEHYTADITRTIAIGTPSDRQRAIYLAVQRVQQQAFANLRPGVLLKEAEQQVERLIGEELITLGLIKELDRSDIRRYYPHACSHYLGLTAHDSGDYSQPLQPGMVLTVEPGIYVPEEGIGVRIEDDVLITEQGIEILSDALPRQL